jgi:hypothetical protein
VINEKATEPNPSRNAKSDNRRRLTRDFAKIADGGFAALAGAWEFLFIAVVRQRLRKGRFMALTSKSVSVIRVLAKRSISSVRVDENPA